MNFLFSIVNAALCAVLFYFIGKGIGEALLDSYRSNGGMITAKDIFELKTWTPIAFSIVGAWIGYILTRNKDK